MMDVDRTAETEQRAAEEAAATAEAEAAEARRNEPLGGKEWAERVRALEERKAERERKKLCDGGGSSSEELATSASAEGTSAAAAVAPLAPANSTVVTSAPRSSPMMDVNLPTAHVQDRKVAEDDSRMDWQSTEESQLPILPRGERRRSPALKID